MSYLAEFRTHWRTLVGCMIGISTGVILNLFTMSTFGPALIADLGWSKADYALVGFLPLATMLLMPVAGRFTDRFGTRVAILFGFIAVPLAYIAMSMMRGSITEFLVICMLQNGLGILTTAFVFCRIVVERFDTARGMALAILLCASPLVGAILAPTLAEVIANSGWRVGYLVMAAISTVGGVLTVVILGRKQQHTAASSAEKPKLSRQEFIGLMRHPVFLLLLVGMFLVNLPMSFATSQLKVIATDLGTPQHAVAWMVSLYPMGVIAGRFVAGLALDRIPPHFVAAIILALPAIGFFALSAQLSATPLVLIAIIVIGLAHGAESDIGAFMLSRRFDLKNFSLLLSFLNMMVGAGSAVGSVILSVTLRSTQSYVPFLLCSAVATLIGAALFGLSGLVRTKDPALGHASATSRTPAFSASVAADNSQV